jgi:hypothetical protein
LGAPDKSINIIRCEHAAILGEDEGFHTLDMQGLLCMAGFQLRSCCPRNARSHQQMVFTCIWWSSPHMTLSNLDTKCNPKFGPDT